jgi:hypothetical protein
MNRIPRHSILLLGCVVLGAVLLLSGPGQSASLENPKPVAVTNFPPEQDVNVLNTVDVNVVNTEANPVPVSHPKTTHMGRTPQEHVNLEIFGDPACTFGREAVQRVFPDGTRLNSAFVVPIGKVLVITDISATIRQNVPWSAGDIALAALFAGSDLVYNTGVAISSDAVSSGLLAINTTISSGALIGAGETPCLDGGVVIFNGGADADLGPFNMQGYLIDE